MTDRRLPGRRESGAGGWQAGRDAAAPGRALSRGIAAASVADEVLVERAQAGDRGSFEVLVRRHADRLYAVVLPFTANSAEAEEVTQEAFLRAWRGIARFEGRSQFFTWLYRIGINEAKRRAEQRPAIGKVVSLEEEPVEQAADPSESPPVRSEHGELRAQLERAIRELPPDYRLPLVLRDVEGLSTAEAAAVMELGEAAFKSRLHRARLAVREAIDHYLDEAGDR